MAVQVEKWQDQIEKNLYADNDFMNRAMSGDQYVVGNSAVHIPNSAQPGPVVRNRQTASPVIRRADTDVIYVLDNFSTTAQLVHWNSTQELSYNFRENVILDETANLRQVMGDSMLTRWTANLGAAQVIRTSGGAVPTTLGGATGTRKAFRKEDLLTAALLMDKQNVPAQGRVALLPADYYATLLADKDLTVNFARYGDLSTGAVPTLYGFDLMKRSTGLVTNNAAVPVPQFLYDADGNRTAAGADANQGVLCWHPSFVERATGEVKFFYRENDPIYMGDIYSFIVRIGGRHRRADGKGLVAIIEAPAA